MLEILVREITQIPYFEPWSWALTLSDYPVIIHIKHKIKTKMGIIIFHYSQPKHMLWVLKKAVTMSRSFEHPKTNVRMMDKKIFMILCQNYLFII